MRFSNLDQWLKWQETLHSASIDMGLARVEAVAATMGLLQPAAKVVTVAGTNGKGSCVATLEALLLADGCSVGAFTSPHFHRYNERIRINGFEVDDELLCESFQRIDDARGDLTLTYFEFGTLAAMDIFQRQGVQYMVLEVGLGGRLDAVNILDADIGVVTSIALDHEDWLGSDLQQIGREKAGIFRENSWAICADQKVPTSVREQADAVGAHWIGMGEELGAAMETNCNSWHWSGIDDRGSRLSLPQLPPPPLPINSVAAALQAYVLLTKSLPEDVNSTIRDLSLPGRSQLIECNGITFILDVAHNPAAALYQADRLHSEAIEGKTYCVAAIMADKQRSEIFKALNPAVNHWHLCSLPNVSRAATAKQLQSDLNALGVDGEIHESVDTCLQCLTVIAEPGDRVLIMGSFFTIAEALNSLTP